MYNNHHLHLHNSEVIAFVLLEFCPEHTLTLLEVSTCSSHLGEHISFLPILLISEL